MSREDLHFRLRLPENLKLRVQEAAEFNKRSMTAEIVSRLEKSFISNIPEKTNHFEEYAENVAKLAATEAANKAINAIFIVLDAMKELPDEDRSKVLNETLFKQYNERPEDKE